MKTLLTVFANTLFQAGGELCGPMDLGLSARASRFCLRCDRKVATINMAS